MSVGRVTVAVAAAAACAALGAGCGSGEDSSSGGSGDGKPSVDYVAILALSGPLGAYGGGEKAAIQASVDHVNATGGIDGRKVKLKVLDDGGDGTQAASLLQREIASGKPDLVYAGVSSDETVAMCPILKRNNILGVAVTGTVELDNMKNCGTTFSASGTPEANAKAMANYIKQDGHASAALMTTSDAYGDTVEAAARKVWASQGVKLTGVARVSPDDIDATAQWKKLRSTGAEAVEVEGIGAAPGHMIDSRVRSGWDVPTFGGAGTASSNLSELSSKKALEGIKLVSWAIGVDGKQPVPDQFATALAAIKKAAGGKLSQPLVPYAFAWDMAHIVQAAAKEAGSLDTTKMKATLEGWAAKEPAEKPWMAHTVYPFSGERHLLDSPTEDFAVAQPGALNEDGQLQAAAG